MTVREIMASPVTTVDMDDPIRLVEAHFESGGFHHLPVVDSRNRIVGLVSERDYLKAISPFLHTPSEARRDLDLMGHHVHTIMSRNPVTVSPDISVGEAARILTNNHFSSLLVADEEGVLKGIVTWKDFVRILGSNPALDVESGVLRES